MSKLDAFIAVLRELSPIITAATPVLLVIVNWWVTRKQSKDLKKHSDVNAKEIKTAVSDATGVFKALP